VFHIAFLKKFEGVPPGSVPPLPPIVRGRAVAQPDKVVRARPTKNSWEVLVQWQGKTAGEATWESLEQFKEDCPEFQLEDELFRQGGGSVIDMFFGKKYVRRPKKDSANSPDRQE
jgi:hypothetical protein